MPEPLARHTPLSNEAAVGSLVGEFLEEKRRERQEEKARQVVRKKNPLVLPLMIVLTIGIWVLPSLMPPVEPTLSPATLEKSARLNLYLASLRVREYIVKNQRLPATLIDAGVDTTGLEFSKGTGTEFELTTRVAGTRLLYRSTMPDSVFLGDARIRGIS